MKCSNRLTVAVIAAVVASVFAAPEASAATAPRRHAVNASGVCQAALLVFDVNIRKRPKAVQNEGSAPAYVTCTLMSDGAGSIHQSNPTAVQIWVRASDGQADSLTCTGVLGWDGAAFPYVPKTVSLAASGEQHTLAWAATDFGGAQGAPLPSGLFSVSCKLNPGVALNDFYMFYKEDIGS